jgi:hypothetical protein
MKNSIRVLEDTTYDISDAEQKKEFKRHYQRIYTKIYRERNRETCLAYRRQYYQTHKEQYTAYRKKYEKERPQETVDLIRVKSAISNYIQYNYNEGYREHKKEDLLKKYHIKKERYAKEDEKITVCFD